MLKVIKLSRVISCWCKVVEFLCGKLRNSADEIFLPGIVKIAHSSSNSTCGKRPRTLCRSRHQQQTMTLTRAGHTTGTACMRNCKFLHEQVRGGPAGEMGHSGRPRWGQGAPRCRDPVPVHFPPPEPVLLAPQTKVAAFQGWRRLLLRGRFLPVLVVGRAHGTAES